MRRAATAMLLLASGCSSTQLATYWRNPDDGGGAVRRLLVMAPEARSAADRIIFETRLASVVRTKTGAEATTLFSQLPAPDAVSDDDVQRVIDNGAFDGVLVVRLIDVTQKLEASSTVRPAFGWGYGYGYGYGAVAQNTVRSYDVVSLEASLHRIPGLTIAWTGRTETADLSAPEDLAAEVGALLVKELTLFELLPPRAD